MSSSTVARLKEKWHAELAQWQTRRLEDLEAVDLWVAGIYVKAGLEKEKAAVRVVLAALSDGRKVVLAVTPGYRESTASWSAVLRDLQPRGLRAPRLVIGDAHLGIWAALRTVYPEAEEQRCWNHKILNVLDKPPKRQHPAAPTLLKAIPCAPTQREAVRRREQFVRWCAQQGHAMAAACATTKMGSGLYFAIKERGKALAEAAVLHQARGHGADAPADCRVAQAHLLRDRGE